MLEDEERRERDVLPVLHNAVELPGAVGRIDKGDVVADLCDAVYEGNRVPVEDADTLAELAETVTVTVQPNAAYGVGSPSSTARPTRRSSVQVARGNDDGPRFSR